MAAFSCPTCYGWGFLKNGNKCSVCNGTCVIVRDDPKPADPKLGLSEPLTFDRFEERMEEELYS